MEVYLYTFGAMFYAGLMIWLPFYLLGNPILAAALNVSSFFLAVLAILINHAFRSADPIIEMRHGLWIILFGLLGLPWLILLKTTRQDTLFKKAMLFLWLIRLPVCDSSRVQQKLSEEKNPAVFQTWLETRTLAQMLKRYAQDSAVREHDSLWIRPSHRWQSDYFTMSSSIFRIGKNVFLDHSTHTLSS